MFEWATCYPDLKNICERFGLYELENVHKIKYTPLESVLQEGPQCGLVALAICMGKPNKTIVKQLYEEAKDAGYTYNGELFSAKDFIKLVQGNVDKKVTLHEGILDCQDIKTFLLEGGLMLVPQVRYDCDKNHSPCKSNGQKAHWAVVSGILITEEHTYVVANHGKSKNTAIWRLTDLSESNAQLEEFSEDRKLSGKMYKLPDGGIGEDNGLKKKSICIWSLFQRNIGKNIYKWHGEGIQYPGFKYYPRDPDFKDPPYEASKLFKVQRIKPFKGAHGWEKHILEEFKLDGKQSDIAIVKNIPENNARLWRIKHLVKIVPITFPNGFPGDTTGTYLKENGELLVAKSLQVHQDKLLATEKFQTDIKKMDGDTLRRESRKRWNTGWKPL
ncbi:hypothetical protein FQR65_LT04232 [Abscondita terminalis]|nr:hypothetical protein FQR65_LT04232 [Abscondita terminalis]